VWKGSCLLAYKAMVSICVPFSLSSLFSLLSTRLRNYGMNSKVAELLGKKKYFGDAIMKVSAFTSELREHVLPLIDPETGGSEASLTIEGRLMSKEEAQCTREDVCFQYQRFQLQWRDDNLLPTDPGR
jgi:hypothetical protein